MIIKRIYYFLFILAMLSLDQITKYLVVRHLPPFSRVNVIPGFFTITHIHNRGAIFGFLSQSGSQTVYYLLLLASVFALFLVIYYFFKSSPDEKFLELSLSLILAGALGNLVDRIGRGYVIDFMDFHFNQWHWPSFNIADSCVSLGALLLIFILFFKRRS